MLLMEVNINDTTIHEKNEIHTFKYLKMYYMYI